MSSFAVGIAASAPIGQASSLVGSIDANLGAAKGAAAVSGDPMLDGRVSSLLRAIGGPSMAVKGQKTRLGGKVGTLLQHINPSMAARLARRFIGKGVRASQPAHPRQRLGVVSAANASHPRLRISGAGHSHRTNPLVGLQLAGASRQAECHAAAGIRPSEQGGRMVGQVPAADNAAPRFAPPPLGWPWDKPAPTPSQLPPPPPPTAYASPLPAGQVINLFA
ncbi:MAG: hypothetical protein BIFFINMI_01954 [Phycisphaerae bacterium]|nr:hypothetical protein [Phycisphaerae bacterium]